MEVVGATRYVRFVPIADIGYRSRKCPAIGRLARLVFFDNVFKYELQQQRLSVNSWLTAGDAVSAIGTKHIQPQPHLSAIGVTADIDEPAPRGASRKHMINTAERGLNFLSLNIKIFFWGLFVVKLNHAPAWT